MTYWILLFILIVIILTIVIDIIFTIVSDTLARESSPTDPVLNSLLNNVINLNGFLIIILIFIIALILTSGILAYYHIQTGSESKLVLYILLTVFFSYIGAIVLEYYIYNNLKVFESKVDNDVVTSSLSTLLWGIILSIITLIITGISMFFT